jgi:hypothetical protein
MTRAPAFDAIDDAIDTLEHLNSLLARTRAGMIPPETWLLFRYALADAIEQRGPEDHCQDCQDEGGQCGPHARDAWLRDAYRTALDALGGDPDYELLAPLEA